MLAVVTSLVTGLGLRLGVLDAEGVGDALVGGVDAVRVDLQQDGTWSMLAEAQNGVVPDDLREQLAADEAAARNFDAFSRSAKRAILESIARAKRPETRQRRIARTVECAAQNRRPGSTSESP